MVQLDGLQDVPLTADKRGPQSAGTRDLNRDVLSSGINDSNLYTG